MNRNLSRTEKEEITFQKFVNKYKYASYSEMCLMTLSIKSSDISSYEYTLKEILIGGIERMTLGQLCSSKIIIERLITYNDEKKIKELYSKILDAIEKT